MSQGRYFHIGGAGTIPAYGIACTLNKPDCLYIVMGTNEVSFTCNKDKYPAGFYFISSNSHRAYITTFMKNADAPTESFGNAATDYERIIYKYLHETGIKSGQFGMGLTVLKDGYVWNTMPAHIHTRRMEVYLYFDLVPTQRVFHFIEKVA